MLFKFNEKLKGIILESAKEKFECADDLLEELYDKIGFTNFLDLLQNNDLIEKLKNSDKEVLEEAMEGLLHDSIEKYDEDQEESKKEAEKIYNYLKEIVLKKI